MDCDICADKFTSEKRKQVECPGCELKACRECVRRYLTADDMLQDPHCMGCRIGWSQSVVFKAVGQSFANKNIIAHRRKVLLEREKSKIPQTQEYAVARRDLPILEDKYLKKRMEFEDSIRKMRHEWQQKNSHYGVRIKKLKSVVYPHTNEERARSVFVHKCTLQGCEGFLSSSWKCGVCENYTCRSCGKNVGKRGQQMEEHVCLEDDIASFSLIMSQCKPCPKCAAQIYKIEGCDQMWCTMCQTPFSWRTGLEIVGNIIHNPHFFEWQRNRSTTGEIPRQPHDLACGGRITVHDITHAVNCIFREGWDIEGSDNIQRRPLIEADTNIMMSFMYWLLMKKNHYGDVEMRMLQPREGVVEIEDKKLLADFIVNTIDENTLAQKLGIKDKKRRFNAEYYGILETFTTVIDDMLQKMCREARDLTWPSDTIHGIRVEILKNVVELHELAQYLTKSVNTLCVNYGYSQGKFTNELYDLDMCIGYLFQRISQPKDWDTDWIPHGLVIPDENWWPPRGFLLRAEYRY